MKRKIAKILERLRKDKSLRIKVIVVALTTIVLAVCGLVGLEHWDKTRGEFPEHEVGNGAIEYEGKVYVPKKNIETFLVLGLDKYTGDLSEESYNNDRCADFLMLLVYDNDAKTCTAIQINRDTMATMNILGVAGNVIDTKKAQITLSHTYGNGKDVSCRNTANSVSGLLNGVKIDHYISLTMDAVIEFNDLLGGVEVEILDDFTYFDPAMVQGATITLTGEQALRYVQIRKDLEDSTNSARMNRQQQYTEALYAKFQECMKADEDFVLEATANLSGHIVSDRSVNQLETLAKKFDEYTFLGIRNIDGTNAVVNGFVEFTPNEASIQKLVVELFYTPEQ